MGADGTLFIPAEGIGGISTSRLVTTMTTSVESGQGDSPDELEDGELPDSDDEADKADASVEASKPFSQGPALGTKVKRRAIAVK